MKLIRQSIIFWFVVAIIFIVVFLVVNKGFGQEYVVNPPIGQIATAIEEGYKVRAMGSGKFLVFNDCDTLEVNRSAYTTNQWQKIRRFYRLWRPAYASLKRSIRNLSQQVPYPLGLKIYFVAREDRMFNWASNGLLGLDSTMVANARKSITKAQGEYWRVLRMRIDPSDSTTAINSPHVHYLVPFECTLDSLRNYLNDVNSNPQWTSDLVP